MKISLSAAPLKGIAITIAAASLLAGCSQNNDSAIPKQVRFILNAPYVPFEYQDANGNLKGFDVDLGKALCSQAKLSCTWSSQSWDSLIPSLLSRKADAIMSAMTVTPQRQHQLLFSNPYIVEPSAWFVPSNAQVGDISPQDIKGKHIGVQRGTLQDDYVTDLYGNDNTINRYGSVDDMTIDLQAGRIDMAFVDYPIGQQTFINATHGAFKQVGDMISTPKKYFGDGFAIAFRPGDHALADKFNQALSELKQNGKYQQLVNEYFKTSANKSGSNDAQ